MKPREYYQQIARHAGRQYACLDQPEGWDRSNDPILNLTTTEPMAGEGGATAQIRIKGPISDLYGASTEAIIEDLDSLQPLAQVDVLIDSPGGYLQEGIALYSDLRARARSGTRIRTEGGGLVASAATVIFLAGDERVLRPETKTMIHAVHGGINLSGTLDDMERQWTENKKLFQANSDQLRSILAGRTSLTSEAINEIFDEGDYWMAADEAAEKGFATSVVDDAPEKSEESKAENMIPTPSESRPTRKVVARRILANYRRSAAGRDHNDTRKGSRSGAL